MRHRTPRSSYPIPLAPLKTLKTSGTFQVQYSKSDMARAMRLTLTDLSRFFIWPNTDFLVRTIKFKILPRIPNIHIQLLIYFSMMDSAFMNQAI